MTPSGACTHRWTSAFFCIAVLVGLSSTGSSLASPVEWSVGSGGNGHFYDSVPVPSGISWTDANAAAQQLSHLGVGGHLAAITSGAENVFVFSQVANSPALWNGQGPWLGGYRDPNDPLYGSNPAAGWHWVTGEAWSFTNWAAGEPSQGFQIPTDSLQFFIDTLTGIGPAPYWNDTFNVNPNVNQPVLGFIVEYPIPAPSSAIAVLSTTLCMLRRRR